MKGVRKRMKELLTSENRVSSKKAKEFVKTLRPKETFYNISSVLQLHSGTLVHVTIPMDPIQLTLDVLLASNGD